MNKKLNAITEDCGDGDWLVHVTDTDTMETVIITIKAATEKDAAFKAMEQVNEQ